MIEPETVDMAKNKKAKIKESKAKNKRNKVVTKPQARSNCDVISFRSDMGTDGPTNARTNQPT
jgi:hypothetical protein